MLYSLKPNVVYSIFPVAGVLCIIAVIVNIVVRLTSGSDENENGEGGIV